jgi:hypothetical protein
MSYYLAMFGREPDLAGLRDVRVLRGSAVPGIGHRTMFELARTHDAGEPHFVVDETGDTAHELLGEAWPLGHTGAMLDATRLGDLLSRAEASHAGVAVWDADWSEATDGPPEVFGDYTAFRAFFMRCASLGEIGGVICVPQDANLGSVNGGA